MRGYIELLKNKTIRGLISIQFILAFASWFSNVAIYTMLVEFNSKELTIAIITAMHFLPAVIIAPFSGAIIDKVSLKSLMKTLIVVEFCMTLLFLTISSNSLVWLLGIFIFVRMSAASMYFSSEMSLMAKLLKGDKLQKANELNSIIWSFTYAAGMAISGLVVHIVGIKIAFVIDAFMFFVSFFLFSTIDLKTEIKKHNDRFLELIKDGFLYIKNNKIILKLILLHSCVGLTSFDTLITLLAKYDYATIIAVPLAIGLSNATRAVGLMIGPFFISKYLSKDSLHIFLLLQGLSIIVWALVQYDFYYSLVAQFLVGLTTTSLWSITYALLQEKCDEKYLGRVISYNDMFFMLSCILTTLFIGFSAKYINLEQITICLGFAFVGFAYYYKRIKKWI